MNGGEKQIMNVLTEIKTLQRERHGENKKDFKVLYREVKEITTKLSNLPCGIHIERMKWHDRWMVLLGVGFIAIIGWMAKVHITG